MSARHRSTAHRRKAVVSLIALLAGCAAVIGLQFPGAYGGYIAKVTNGNDTAQTSTYFSCGNAALGETGTKAYFSYPFGETSGTTAADASGNNRPGTYSNVTLGTTNTGTGAVCPRDNKSVITLNGTNAYVIGPAAPAAAPNVFSEEIWFKTGSAQGKLIGFGSSNGASGSLTYDRHLYVDANARLEFGVGTGTTVVSGATVNDNVWHHAVGTLSSAGMALYLDGALVGSNTGVTSGVTYLTGGYWRIGYDSLLLWPNAPASNYFKGNLAFAAVYTVALTPTQVAAHYAAGR